MILDITAPEDTELMANFSSFFRDAKTAIVERLECEERESFKAHGDRTTLDFGIHAYGTEFALVHDTYTALENYTPKVEGSLHIVSSDDTIYTIRSGVIVSLEMLSHLTLANVDAHSHDNLYYRRDADIVLDTPLVIGAGGSIVTTGQEYTQLDHPLEVAHVAKTHYEAHGDDSLTVDNLADDTYEWANNNPYEFNGVSGGIVLTSYNSDPAVLNTTTTPGFIDGRQFNVFNGWYIGTTGELI